MKVGFKRAPDKARVVPKAGGGPMGKRTGAEGTPPGIPKKLAAAKAALALKRSLEAPAADSAAEDPKPES